MDIKQEEFRGGGTPFSIKKKEEKRVKDIVEVVDEKVVSDKVVNVQSSPVWKKVLKAIILGIIMFITSYVLLHFKYIFSKFTMATIIAALTILFEFFMFLY